jgi:hypothetical protein
MKVIIFVYLLFSLSARAEIEKVARIEPPGAGSCKGDLCFYWWPKLVAPKGWHQDKSANYQIGGNVFIPDDSTFSNSDSIVYGRAIYKPRRPELKSLEDLIAVDKKEFIKNVKGVKISTQPSLQTAAHQNLKVFKFAPKRNGNWELVAYGEEDKFYILFTLSSRTESAFKKTVSEFKTIIANYR